MTLPVRLWFTLKAGALFWVIVAIANTHRPFARFGPADRITLGRAFLVALAAGFVGEPAHADAPTAAALLGAVATAFDGLDGWVARRTRTTSAFGARFDMEVDALLVLVLAILTWQYRKAGSWVLASGLFRYIFVAAGWMWPWLKRPLAPTFRARAICVLQIAALLIALAPAVRPPASDLVAAAGLMALTYSFAADTFRLWGTRYTDPLRKHENAK